MIVSDMRTSGLQAVPSATPPVSAGRKDSFRALLEPLAAAGMAAEQSFPDAFDARGMFAPVRQGNTHAPIDRMLPPTLQQLPFGTARCATEEPPQEAGDGVVRLKTDPDALMSGRAYKALAPPAMMVHDASGGFGVSLEAMARPKDGSVALPGDERQECETPSGARRFARQLAPQTATVRVAVIVDGDEAKVVGRASVDAGEALHRIATILRERGLTLVNLWLNGRDVGTGSGVEGRHGWR